MFTHLAVRYVPLMTKQAEFFQGGLGQRQAFNKRPPLPWRSRASLRVFDASAGCTSSTSCSQKT